MNLRREVQLEPTWRHATALGSRDWADAADYARRLRSGALLPVEDDPRIPLARGEVARLSTIANCSRRFPARAGGAWGDRHSAAIIATTARLVINHRLKGWVSFWLKDVCAPEVHIDQSPWWIDLTWRHGQAPLRLAGTTAPILAVHVASHTNPSGWTTTEGLQELLATSAAQAAPETGGATGRLTRGATVVVTTDHGTPLGRRATSVPAGTHGVLVSRQHYRWRVRFDNGQETLVDPNHLDLVPLRQRLQA